MNLEFVRELGALYEVYLSAMARDVEVDVCLLRDDKSRQRREKTRCACMQGNNTVSRGICSSHVLVWLLS